MKKVLTLVAAAMAAGMTHAASIQWQSGSLQTMPNFATDWANETVYFFIVGSSDYDLSTVTASLADGTLNAGNIAGYDALKNIVAVGPNQQANVVGTDTSWVAGEVAYGYGVIFSGDNTKYAISTVRTSAAFPASGNANLNLGGTAGFTIGNVTPVPEPATSMLALAGVALLLRRRRK